MARLGALVVLGFVAATSPTACSAAVPELTVSTDRSLEYSDRADSAGVFGTVGMEQSGTNLCVYVQSTRGIAEGRVDLVFPAGYTGTRNGELRDSSGAVVAKRGDRVSVSVAPELTSRRPAGCSAAGVGTARALHVDAEGAEP